MTLEDIQAKAMERGIRSSIKNDTLVSSRSFGQDFIEKFNLIEEYYDEEDGDDDNSRPIMRKIFTYKIA